MVAVQKRSLLHEDWVVVILGFLVIVLAVAGVKPAVPAYSWSTSADLTSKILTAKNLGLIGLQFLFVFVIALLGAFLTAKPLRSMAIVFPFIYVVTIIAVIVAGN